MVRVRGKVGHIDPIFGTILGCNQNLFLLGINDVLMNGGVVILVFVGELHEASPGLVFASQLTELPLNFCIVDIAVWDIGLELDGCRNW